MSYLSKDAIQTIDLFFYNGTFINFKIFISLLEQIYIIIHCLTSDSDPCWAHADYSLYTCGEKTLFEKTP